MKLIGENNHGSGIRLYRTKRNRKIAVGALRRKGRNYFVGFVDANENYQFGLSYGKADWAGLFPYIKDV